MSFQEHIANFMISITSGISLGLFIFFIRKPFKAHKLNTFAYLNLMLFIYSLISTYFSHIFSKTFVPIDSNCEYQGLGFLFDLLQHQFGFNILLDIKLMVSAFSTNFIGFTTSWY